MDSSDGEAKRNPNENIVIETESMPVEKEQQKQSSNLISVIFWFIFGGGLIMMIVWIVFALIATLLVIPSSSSINLLEMLPVVIAPPRYYPDIKTVNPECLSKTSRVVWTFTFGLIISIIHFVLMIIYSPLSCCGISWSSYHLKAMTVAFNPYGKIVIDRNANRFTWFSTSEDVLRNANDLAGKVAIVTGCNTGIGKETAKQLYSKGCIVIMACRNQEKANNARNDILQEIKGQNEDNLIIIRIDLGDLKTIDEFVASFQENEIVNGKLAYLINNAGLGSPTFRTTKEGFEMQYGVMHMGHFYLTNKLWPIIKQNKTRIVIVTSIGHYLYCTAKDMRDYLTADGVKGPTEDIIPYDLVGLRYYGIAKVCNILMARRINKLYNKDGIYALTVHPGSVLGTDLSRDAAFDCSMFLSMFEYRFLHEILKGKSISQGAATTLRCVTISNEEIDNNGGEQLLYFDDCLPRNDKLNFDFMDGKNSDIDDMVWDYSCKGIQACDYLQLNEF